MALSIISNQAASIATRNLGQANQAATDTAQQLSTGKRVNSAADDAAASAIAARLSAEVAGLQQASVNAGQASSLLQIADGAFQNVEDILTRAKSLSVQAGSDQISDQERSFLDQEFQALKNEIDRIASDTEFNGTKLVNGDVTTNAVSGANTATSGLALMGPNGTTFNNTGTIQNIVTGIATVGGGTGRIAQGNFVTGASATANTLSGNFGQMNFVTGGANVAGFQGVNFNVDLGMSMTISQTIQGNMVEQDLRSASFNVMVMATGNTATAVAMLTFTAMAGVMTNGGSTASRTFSFQSTISANPLAAGNTTITGAGGAFTAVVNTAGMITVNVAPTMDVTLKAQATTGTFGGSVTLMLTGGFGGNISTTAAAGATQTSTGAQDVLLTGQENMAFTFKVGTGVSSSEDEISVSIGGISTSALGIDNANVLTAASADQASEAVSAAIDELQAKRSEVGASQNRLDFAQQNVDLARENQEAARSQLEDLNVARAITDFSQQQLLVQAGTSTLSQANNLPQNLLQLFN